MDVIFFSLCWSVVTNFIWNQVVTILCTCSFFNVVYVGLLVSVSFIIIVVITINIIITVSTMESVLWHVDPLLGNGPINTPSWQQKKAFSVESVPKGYLKDDRRYKRSVEPSCSREAEKRWRSSQFSWGFSCGVLTSGQRKRRFVTRKCLVKTRQGNSHCGELLPSND
jgi:hypothetical protein